MIDDLDKPIESPTSNTTQEQKEDPMIDDPAKPIESPSSNTTVGVSTGHERISNEAESTPRTVYQTMTTDGNTGEKINPYDVASRYLLPPQRKAKKITIIGNNTGEESIIGQDDRHSIIDASGYPWCMICSLEIISDFGTFVGTGWLAGPRTVVTAGHCVYHEQMGGWANKVLVRPGRFRAHEPLGVEESNKFQSVLGWVNGRELANRADYDYGVIQLNLPIGDKTGWFKIMVLNDHELTDVEVNICGYPATPGNGMEQWHHSETIKFVNSHRLYYQVDTSGGQSGSPVWLKNNDPTSVQGVVGIHAYGIGGTPTDIRSQLGIPLNSCPRITPSVFNNLNYWIENASK